MNNYIKKLITPAIITNEVNGPAMYVVDIDITDVIINIINNNFFHPYIY